MTKTADFDVPAAGTLVDGSFAADGVRVLAPGGADPARTAAQRAESLELFPELGRPKRAQLFQAASRNLKRHEAELLALKKGVNL